MEISSAVVVARVFIAMFIVGAILFILVALERAFVGTFDDMRWSWDGFGAAILGGILLELSSYAHEVGHILVTLILGYKFYYLKVELIPLTTFLEYISGKDPIGSFLVGAAGPFVSFLFCIGFSYGAFKTGGKIRRMFLAMAIWTVCVILLCLGGTDGGMMGLNNR